MECGSCKERKLSEEFADEYLMGCKHRQIYCLKCSISTKKCSQVSCLASIGQKNLDKLILKYNNICPPPNFLTKGLDKSQTPVNDNDFEIKCSFIDGTSFFVKVKPSMEISELKQIIADRIKEEPGKIRLAHGSFTVDVYKNYSKMNVGKHNLTKDSILNVLILMTTITQRELKNVVFDLYWKFPHDKRDFLDATCLIFSRAGNFTGLIDFGQRTNRSKSITHSGDGFTDDVNRTGHHKIKVNLETIPEKDHDRLYFILSSWDSPNMSSFQPPTVRVYEESKPDTELSSFQLKHVNDKQAIVMCCLIRRTDVWDIVTVGRGSKGNAKTDYAEVKESITKNFKELDITE